MLPLYQLDDSVLRIIAKAFLEVFPDGQAYLTNVNIKSPILALIGFTEHSRYPPDWFDRRVQSDKLRQELEDTGLSSKLRLFGRLLASSVQLHQLASNDPLNTDDHPLVMFKAPDFVYNRASHIPAYASLLTLLSSFQADTGGLIDHVSSYLHAIQQTSV